MIPTAEEFLDLQHETVPSTKFDIRQVMIGFAQMHVKAALKGASESIEVSRIRDKADYPFKDINTILESYPESNIR